MEKQEERIINILDAIIKVAQGDYSIEVELLGENDDLDALAMGINMMVYDLREKYETEKENERVHKLNERLKLATKKAEESDRLKSAFLANMSHEIRTPMNSILGFAGLLKKPNLSDQNKNKYVDLIERGGKRMLNIINELIDISKIESGQMEIYYSTSNISEIVEGVYSFFKPEAESKGLQLLLNIEENLKETRVKTDIDKLTAILTNLIKNALKFTEKGIIEIGLRKSEEILEFYVKDSGIGIPADKLDIIFDRFSQVKDPVTSGYEGSGLGLSISKAYTNMLGGKMWVKSLEGHGSTFYFTIIEKK